MMIFGKRRNISTYLMKNKKYKLSDETIQHEGKTLYRIIALRDLRDLSGFGRVKKGDAGGFVESEKNLSQEGNCWIYDNALVFEDDRVSEDSIVYGYAEVSQNDTIC